MQTTSSTSEQDADKMLMWMIVAIVFLVAILLAITSIALGTMLCLTRKSLKSVPDSKLPQDEGKFATPFKLHVVIYIHTRKYLHSYIVSVHV